MSVLAACEHAPTDSRSGCDRCHAPLTDAGVPGGIEMIHPSDAPLACVTCHGGDSDADTKEEAHVPRPAGVASARALRQLSPVELDAVDPRYVQWVNPGDCRVTQQTCALAGCHPDISATSTRSIMSTLAGHWNHPRFSAGQQADGAAAWSVHDYLDIDWDGAPGTVQELHPLDPAPLTEDSSLGDHLDHYLAKNCPSCHLWAFGPQEEASGDYRSSGCSGCHVVYAEDGRSQSDDPNADPDAPAHPVRHRMTSAIPDAQCETCHVRMGTMYRGVREAARIGDPPNVEATTQPLHGLPAGGFISDEDTTNDVDETPPDVHQTAGLGCVDCHVGKDVHGDGRLYSADEYQVGVECEDCHGTPRESPVAGEDGLFRTTGGDPLRRLRVGPDGSFVLRGALTGADHPVSQLAVLQASGSEALVEGHGVLSTGFSHLETMECYACHIEWMPACFGCHVTVDVRASDASGIDGTVSAGRASEVGSWVALDYFVLGVGSDGLITPMAPQEKMFVTVIAPCDPDTEPCDVEPTDDGLGPGRTVWKDQIRHTAEGDPGMGLAPFTPHTTSSGVQPCDRCHHRIDSSNSDIVMETIGRGSGRFVIPDGDGVEHDLTRTADSITSPVIGVAHEGSSLLDMQTVNGMLHALVEDSGLEQHEVVPWTPPAAD
ncbi:MAG: cytochrome c3 family protein [Proteobacteria bacterium]|nr:cytochrome c3 family protein [Pseudomonadota bacterium]